MPPRKKPGAAIKAKGEDEDGFAPTLTSKQDLVPEKYPPLDPFPTPPPITTDSLSFAETSRRLRESMLYSGYRITNQTINESINATINQSLNQSNQSINHSNNQSASQCSVPLVRYSDKYRRRIGIRRLKDEILKPSPLIFPPEILKILKQSKDQSTNQSNNQSINQSINQFMSAHMIEEQMEKLINQSSVLQFEELQARADAAKALQSINQSNNQSNNQFNGEKDGDEDDNDKDDENTDTDDMDEEDEGDYAERYQEDDDGEGGEGVWGEDEGEVF